MNDSCNECGAPLSKGGACKENFYALLYLESEAAAAADETLGERGQVAHFYAVGAYALQHPEGMSYTPEALAGLRRALADHLAGRASLEAVRRQVRDAAQGPTPVIRRDPEPPVRWPVESWPVTVADVLAGGVEGYAERAAEWARAVLQTLDEVAG